METRPKILVVDDVNPDGIADVFVISGFEVRTAQNGAEALELIEQETPDIILSDLNMPGMGGLELCRILKSKEKYKNIPFIMMSARDSDVFFGKLYDDFLKKPMDADELLQCVTWWLKYHLLQVRVHDIFESTVSSDKSSKPAAPPAIPDSPLQASQENTDPAALFHTTLEHQEDILKGQAIIQLAKQQRETPHPELNNTPAQKAFWHNVRHSLGSYSSPEEAAKRWTVMADLALALIYPETEQNRRLCQLVEEHPNFEIRARAIDALGQNRALESLSIICQATQHANRDIRRAAVEALGQLGSNKGISFIEKTLADPELGVRLAAVHALATLGTEKATQMLRETLIHHADSTMRMDAAQAFAKMDNVISVDILLEALKIENDADVIYSITMTLGQLDDPRVIPALQQLLNHKSEHVKEAARKTLDKLS